MRAIPFTVSTFEGGVFELGSAPERPVVVNFWASWCGPCKLEAKVLERAYEEYGPRGVEFIGVAIQDTADGARRFISEFGLTFPNGLDDTGSIMRSYNVFGIPKTYVIAPGGAVAYTHTGPVSWTGLSVELEKFF
jgi:cytochrome c biogenesis protein CcmG/thiol:disulfide interchange protein DsbE